jgi:ParB family chromosome partitioning protein
MERLKRNGEVLLVPVEQIIVNEEKNNRRVDYGDIAELAESILNSGLKNPILVRKVRGEETYELMHGHRRFRAIQSLIEKGEEFPRVRAFIAPKNYNEDDVLLDMIVMNDGKPLNNYEQGLVYFALENRGFTIKEISKRVGKSVPHIHNCLNMAKLPKPIQNEVAAGNLSGLTATEIVKNSESEEEALNVVKQSIEKAKAEGKKVTKRFATKNVSLTPTKTLERVKEILNEKNITSKEAEVFKKVLGRLKAKETPEAIAELFM